MSVRTNECQHGVLRRSCVACDIEAQLSLTTRKLEAAMKGLGAIKSRHLDDFGSRVAAEQTLKTINEMKE